MSYICSSIKFSGVINISEVAKNKVIKLMEDDGFNHSSDFVRVGVKSGGCSGLSYEMKFDKKRGVIRCGQALIKNVPNKKYSKKINLSSI